MPLEEEEKAMTPTRELSIKIKDKYKII